MNKIGLVVSFKKRDVLMIKRQPVAKRFMLLTIGEAYEKFRNDFPQCAIGRSKFFEPKPRHVKLIQLHDTCCCMFHANFELLLNPLGTGFFSGRKMIVIIGLSILNQNVPTKPS